MSEYPRKMNVYEGEKPEWLDGIDVESWHYGAFQKLKVKGPRLIAHDMPYYRYHAYDLIWLRGLEKEENHEDRLNALTLLLLVTTGMWPGVFNQRDKWTWRVIPETNEIIVWWYMFFDNPPSWEEHEENPAPQQDGEEGEE